MNLSLNTGDTVTKAPRRSPAEQLAAATKRREQAEVREQRLKAKIRTIEEGRRTRQMILLGTAIAAEMKTDPALAAQVKSIVGKHTVRDHDRAMLAEFLT